MAFFKFRQRGQPAAEAPTRSRSKSNAATPEETVDTLRRRARYRLVGAAVLVLAAVVGFPLIFDTQPRPVAVDVPITIPDKHSAAPLKLPEPVPAAASLDEREEVVADSASRTQSEPASAARPGTPSADAHARPEAAARASAASAPRGGDAKPQDAAAKARRDEADRSKREAEARARREQQAEAARAQRDEARAAQTRRDEERAKARRDEDADAREAAAAEAKAKRDEARREEAAKREQQARDKREADQRAKRDEAARARALLEGRSGGASADKPKADKASADAGKSRFVVQVGAFADDAAVRQARQKAESAGVKTYTQVVNTSAGPRTRVRVGPYGSRAEAEKAAAALKKAGLSGAIVSF